jgi:hypothetical protein
MKLNRESDKLTITWENGMVRTLDDAVKLDPHFWCIIEILLKDAHKEGGIVALRDATDRAQAMIAEKRKASENRIIV